MKMRFLYLILLVSVFFSTCAYVTLYSDDRVHQKLIAQFEENCHISEQMTDEVERKKNLRFSEKTLERMTSDYHRFKAFNTQMGWIVLVTLISAITTGTTVRFRLPAYSWIWLASAVLLMGFIPLIMYSCTMKYTYDAGGWMFITPIIVLWILEIVFIVMAVQLRNLPSGTWYLRSAWILGGLHLASIVYVLLMMSLWSNFNLG